MSNISKYLTLAEATKSNTARDLGIDNTPNELELKAMKNVATKVFDVVREFVGGPLYASSFFRSVKLNANINGASKTSQHCKGEAIDIKCQKYGFGTNAEVFHFIKDNLEFDQLIWEYGTDTEPQWVHVSLKLSGTNRKQVLRKKAGEKYKPWVG